MVNVIDYMPGDTLLHRLNPVVKLGLAAAIIVAIFLSDTYVALLGFLALTLALGAYAGVVDRLFSLLKLLIPLALIMLVLQLAFMRDGNVVWGFITDTGLITGSKACLRLLGVALPLILMLMVTKLNDLANACVEVLHVPYRYAFTFTTALRFVPVFGQEMNAIMEAQTARGVEYDTKNPIKKLKLMLPLCVPLLISSVGKTDATALAAEQRGFYLRTRASSYKRYPIKGLDIAVLIVSIALIAILLLVSVFIISNTIKLTTFDRRDEIAIMKMVGATNGFIRWPFVYEGFMIGLLSAVLGFGLLLCLIQLLADGGLFLFLQVLCGELPEGRRDDIGIPALEKHQVAGYLAAGVLFQSEVNTVLLGGGGKGPDILVGDLDPIGVFFTLIDIVSGDVSPCYGKQHAGTGGRRRDPADQSDRHTAVQP